MKDFYLEPKSEAHRKAIHSRLEELGVPKAERHTTGHAYVIVRGWYWDGVKTKGSPKLTLDDLYSDEFVNPKPSSDERNIAFALDRAMKAIKEKIGLSEDEIKSIAKEAVNYKGEG